MEAQLRAVGENMGEEMPQRIRYIDAKRDGARVCDCVRVLVCLRALVLLAGSGNKR